MRTIQRNVAPGCLAKQPKNQDWGIFMGTPCHVTVGAVLREEQLGLCCYCESEVADSEGHIEHMEPRSRKQSRTYDFTNMAISCDGGGGGVEHCGRYKDDRSKNPICAWDATLFSDPHDLATASLFSYSTIGRIATTTADTAKANYLIDYLGLDCPRLNERRRQHARTLMDTLGDQPDPDLVNWLRQDFLQTDLNGRMKQFHSLSKAILEP